MRAQFVGIKNHKMRGILRPCPFKFCFHVYYVELFLVCENCFVELIFYYVLTLFLYNITRQIN